MYFPLPAGVQSVVRDLLQCILLTLVLSLAPDQQFVRAFFR